MKSFKRFSLTESNIIQNHISKVEKILSKNGIEYNTYNGTVSVPLPDFAKSIVTFDTVKKIKILE